MNAERKPKKCRACRNEFYPFNSLDAFCSPKCKREGKKAKEEAKANKLPKMVKGTEVVAPRKMQELLQYTQDVVNAYILVRDANKPCISCGAFGYGQEFHAGHFRSIGAAKHLRFNEKNIHKQCSHCNIDLSGNRVKYEKRLPARIGPEAVEELKNNNLTKKYTPEYLKRIRKIYALKKRRLERKS